MSLSGIAEGLTTSKRLKVNAKKEDGTEVNFEVVARLDSPIEIEYYQNEGILQYVLRQFLKDN